MMQMRMFQPPVEETQFTAAEYFAGIGLVRMGLAASGWRVVFANDISNKKYEMYRGFFADADQHYRVGDVFKVDPNTIPQTLLATCSFPCIDLSLAGNREGIHGSHSSAFWGFERILEAQQDSAPSLILVENVTGWLSSNRGQDFRLTVQSLNRLGYVCDVFTLDALRFTPQSRPRVFLVGMRTGSDSRAAQRIADRPGSLASKRLIESVLANRDLDWIHLDIPAPPPLLSNGLGRIVERLDAADTHWWMPEEVQRHLAMMTPRHLARVMELVDREDISYRTFFRRRRNGFQRAEVRSDDLAGCLRTAVGGSGKQFLIEVGRGTIRMRAMTPREYARLQGVPDTCPIVADGVQALTGFGDAVCVPAISWIAANVLNPLAERLVPSTILTG